MPTDQQLIDLAENMATVAVLKRQLRERSMVFQVDDKEKAAAYFRRPFNAFYNLEYRKWARIRQWYYRRLTAECESAYARGAQRPCDCPIFRQVMGYAS
jgi:hypothetical protein